jgi:hypothetical protein
MISSKDIWISQSSHVKIRECFHSPRCLADALGCPLVESDEAQTFENSGSLRGLLLQMMNETAGSLDVTAERWSTELVHFFRATSWANVGELCNVSEHVPTTFILLR